METENLRAPKRAPREEASRPAQEGFLQRVISLFAGGNDPERDRRRLLKDIGRQLKGGSYRFYRSKTEEALPALAKFFHEIYSALGPSSVLVENAESSGALKLILIESALTPEQRASRDYFSEKQIRERAERMESGDLEADLKDKLVSFSSIFDSAKAKKIEALHGLLSVFLDLVRFDYFFLLRKFDAGYPELDFRYVPRFAPVNSSLVTDDLKEFLSLIYPIEPAADWDALFNVLAEYRNAEIVSRPDWQKVLRTIVEVRKSRVLELIVRHSDHDPFFKVSVASRSEAVVDDYLAKLRSQAEILVRMIAREKQTRKIDVLAKTVFGNAAPNGPKNYSAAVSTLFTQRMLGGYTYVAPLAYLKAFLLNFFKKDIREIVDLLLVKGRWLTPARSQQLSESYHNLLQVSDDLLTFDESLSPDSDRGVKIRNMLRRSERDKAAARQLREEVKASNETALALIQRSGQSLVVMAKNFKIVLDDYAKSSRELITNWKEIEAASDGKIQAQLVAAYKKIYYFIQLEQASAKPDT